MQVKRHLLASLGFWGIFKVIALCLAIEADRVYVQQAIDKAVKLIQFVQLEVSNLCLKKKKDSVNLFKHYSNMPQFMNIFGLPSFKKLSQMANSETSSPLQCQWRTQKVKLLSSPINKLVYKRRSQDHIKDRRYKHLL